MGTALLIVTLVAFLAAAAWFGIAGMNIDPEYAMPAEGYAMMIVGIVLSLIVGCGLMALLFYSSRRGYDEPPTLVGDPEKDREWQRKDDPPQS